MNGLRKSITALMFLFVVGPFTGSANACVSFVPQNLSDIVTAEIVFVGSVIDYQVVTPEAPETGRRLSDYALITFQVSETLRGIPLEEIQLYWWNTTSGIPSSLRGEGERIVAAIPFSFNAPRLTLYASNETLRGPSGPKLYSVLQTLCSSPFVFPKTPEMLLQVTNALKNPPIFPEPTNTGAFDFGVTPAANPSARRSVSQGRARPSPLNYGACFWSVWIEGKLEEIETACPEEEQ